MQIDYLFRIGLFVLLGLFYSGTHANIIIDIVGGEESAIPIAAIPFAWDGEGDAPVDIAAVIASNLHRTGQFSALPRNEFLERPRILEEVSLGRWRAQGIDFLVIGGVSAAGDDTYRVSFELIDIFTGQTDTGLTYRGVRRNELRYAAHLISNAIHAHLLGESGVFDSRIAYVSIDENNGQRHWRLMYADADGHNPIALVTEQRPLMSPAFSADGRKLAYVSFASRRPEILVRDVFDVETRRIASVDGLNSAPTWSPDGRQLAVAQSREGAVNIFIIDVDSGDRRQLTDHWGIDTEPVWAPDGRHILFTSNRAGSPQIYRVPAEGGRAERITFEGGYNAAPAVSPDGRLLAMVHRGEQGYVIAAQTLTGQQFRILTRAGNEERPTFSPGGNMILYATQDRQGRRIIETVSLYGARTQRVTSQGDIAREPAWSPLAQTAGSTN